MTCTTSIRLGTIVLWIALSSSAFSQDLSSSLPLSPCPHSSFDETPLDGQSETSFDLIGNEVVALQGAGTFQPCDLPFVPTVAGDSSSDGFDLPTAGFGDGTGFQPADGTAALFPSHSPEQIREAASRAAAETFALGLSGAGQGFLGGSTLPAFGQQVGSNYDNLLRELSNHVRSSNPEITTGRDRNTDY